MAWTAPGSPVAQAHRGRPLGTLRQRAKLAALVDLPAPRDRDEVHPDAACRPRCPHPERGACRRSGQWTPEERAPRADAARAAPICGPPLLMTTGRSLVTYPTWSAS